jgi:hypothetical protein
MSAKTIKRLRRWLCCNRGSTEYGTLLRQSYRKEHRAHYADYDFLRSAVRGRTSGIDADQDAALDALLRREWQKVHDHAHKTIAYYETQLGMLVSQHVNAANGNRYNFGKEEKNAFIGV